jgi:hypothetical protein
MKSESDWLLMIDADTFWMGNPVTVLDMIKLGHVRDAAIIGAPVERRDRRGWNVTALSPDGERRLLAREEFDGKILEPEDGTRLLLGCAFMAVNVGWFKRRWPEQPWFKTTHLPGPEPEVVDEAYTICEAVAARGGRVIVDGRILPEHVA